MAATGLDTSVVVRLLVGAPPDQARAARERLERAYESRDVVLVCDIVVAEAFHALHYHYAVPMDEAADLLRRFLRSGLVTPTPAALMRAFETPRSAGFVERLIHERYRDLDAVTLTFDARQARLKDAAPLGTGAS